jgi:predicted dehydrogenase
MKRRREYVVVGTGNRAGTYVEALTGPHRDVGRIAALCDPNPVRADYYRSVYALRDVPVVAPGQFAGLLRRERPDGVIVTSPDHTHDAYICGALDAGVDVISEKPMTVDAERLHRIAAATERSRARLTVTFNYRYSPRNSAVKRLLAEGAIGTVTSVHFEWLLDTSHGADYFRRWHRAKRNSGGLLVHKASHHFDLVNWWLADTPVSVYALGGLKFYGESNASHRGLGPRPRLGRDLPASDPFRLDLAADAKLHALYLDAEDADGYHRDSDVFGGDISIEDSLSLVVGYSRGATMTYSLTAFSPWEGYRVSFNGTGGRLELDVVERSWVPAPAGPAPVSTAPVSTGHAGRVIDPSAEQDLGADSAGSRPVEERIRLQRLWAPAFDVPIPAGAAAHGGGDELLMRDLFRDRADDPLDRAAGFRDGMRSLLVGIAANRSLEEGRLVPVSELGFE